MLKLDELLDLISKGNVKKDEDYVNECTEKILKKYRIPFNEKGLAMVNQLLYDDYGIDKERWKVIPIIGIGDKNWKVEKVRE